MKKHSLFISLGVLFAGSFLLSASFNTIPTENTLIVKNIEALTSGEAVSIPCTHCRGSECPVLVQYADGSLQVVDYQDMYEV